MTPAAHAVRLLPFHVGLRPLLASTLIGVLLAGCGGGQGDSSANSPASAESRERALTARTASLVDVPASRSEAARFLTHATFGPSGADIDNIEGTAA
jgi:hypothetical protein